MDADIESRRIRELKDHDLQYIELYKDLGMVRQTDRTIANHDPH
jgi:hypothetical protein